MILYNTLRFIGSDTLLRLFIKELPWGNERYWCVNKDGSKTECVINYFPANPELASDNGEARGKTIKRVIDMFSTKGKKIIEPPQARDLATHTANLIDCRDYADNRHTAISRRNNDKLVEVMVCDDKKNWLKWKTSFIPLKYLSIKPN